MQLTNIRIAKRELKKAGAILVSTKGNHDKYSNPFTGGSLNLPRHGSKGRTTLSPGCTHEYNKFYNSLIEVKNEASTNK